MMQNQLDKDHNISTMDSEKKIIGLTFKPTPSDRELEWNKTKVLMSKTDLKGNILYANEAFIDVCGYDEFEIINKPHSILRHPDMPKVIFKMMWQTIARGESFHVIIKNMAKMGRYYWVANDLKVTKDSYGIASFAGQQQAVNSEIIDKIIEPLYKKLFQIENSSGVEASENYLIGFLEERGKTFGQYIDDLIYNGEDSFNSPKSIPVPAKKGFLSGIFGDEKPKKGKK
jgi:PAS domain S-box-containing protein